MFIYGGIKECTGGTKRRINGTQAVKYSHYDDFPNLTIEELTKEADKEMYLMKKHYYDVKFNRI